MAWVSMPVQFLGDDIEGSLPWFFGATVPGENVLFGSSNRFCAKFAAKNSEWGIFASRLVSLSVDGSTLAPSRVWVGGRTFWVGGGWSVKFVPAIARWVLEQNTSETHCPTAYQKWNSEEWVGDAWYEANAPTGTFEPRGTLLNGNAEAKVVSVAPVEHWERREDGKSEAPCGIYDGTEGTEGKITVGSESYTEGANTWIRSFDGRTLVSDGGESTSVRRMFTGIGSAYAFERTGILYASPKIADDVNDLEFSPYIFNDETRRYEPVTDGSVAPLAFVFAGFKFGSRKTTEWVADPVVWR